MAGSLWVSHPGFNHRLLVFTFATPQVAPAGNWVPPVCWPFPLSPLPLISVMVEEGALGQGYVRRLFFLSPRSCRMDVSLSLQSVAMSSVASASETP